MRAAWSHNEGEQKDGSPLDSINPDRGVVGLSWLGPDGRLRITGSLTHALAKKRDDVHIAPDVFAQVAEPFLSDAYTVVDLFGSSRVHDHLRHTDGVHTPFAKADYQRARTP